MTSKWTTEALRVEYAQARERIRELKAENERLRKAIDGAPHSIGCAYSIRRGDCNCWKLKVLEGE